MQTPSGGPERHVGPTRGPVGGDHRHAARGRTRLPERGRRDRLEDAANEAPRCPATRPAPVSLTLAAPTRPLPRRLPRLRVGEGRRPERGRAAAIRSACTVCRADNPPASSSAFRACGAACAGSNVLGVSAAGHARARARPYAYTHTAASTPYAVAHRSPLNGRPPRSRSALALISNRRRRRVRPAAGSGARRSGRRATRYRPCPLDHEDRAVVAGLGGVAAQPAPP